MMKIYLFWQGVILIVLSIKFLIFGYDIKHFLTGSDTLDAAILTGSATIFAATIAVVGVSFTIWASNKNKKKELLDNLDSKSEWRKQLYDVASKTFIDTDDVFRVLASLRYFPHKKDDNNTCDGEPTFQEATRTIYKHLYSIIETHKNEIDEILNDEECIDIKVPILSFKESEIVRVYTKYLLKHHWEYNNDKKTFVGAKERGVWEKTEKLIKKFDDNPPTYFDHIKDFESNN
ncbi:hypothetical protein MXM80_10710 [Mammaliicoccus sciuri]|uniref:hypothetical protein n=1 Tax=Mammaliicoccus sciuri TaxID=1296 RepID=UPI002DBA17F2|nr:hypothetical protein [Mammaliicoccus sciuri]MEB6120532.1 hypothetical protein [Mammaliicoccus sciuri]